MKRIGILGGSFDPIHTGHLIIADRVAEELRLDCVLLIPTAVTPHKLNRKLAPAKDRLAMVRAAIRGNPRLQASDIEIRRKGVSYTIDTLRALQQNAKLHLILGADSLGWLPKWREIREIARLAIFVVVRRPHQKTSRMPIKGVRVRFLDSPLIEISSTDIRARVKRGRSIRYLVPEAVDQYIARRKLYR